MPKQKLDARAIAELCTTGFTELQRSQLPTDVWKFLFREVGGYLGAVHQLKASKIKDAAFGFIDGNVGQTYWPLSEMGEWQSEASGEVVQAYVAELMSQQRKKHTEDNPAFMVDLDPLATKTTSTKSPKTPARPVPNQSKLSLSGKNDSPSVTRSTGRCRTPSTKASVSQEAYEPTASIYEKSPTIVPDIPYGAPSTHSPHTPKRSIVPTKAAGRIALDASPSKVLPPTVHNAEDEGHTIEATPKRSVGLGVTASAGSKRSVQEVDRSDQQFITTPTPKRRAIDRPRTPSLVGEQVVPRDRISDSTVVGDMGPSAPSAASSAAPPIAPVAMMDASPTDPTSYDPARNMEATFRACGLSFTPQNIAKIPESLLDYIEECESESKRSANASDTDEKRRHFQWRAQLFSDMYRDLQSRVRCLASNAKEKGRMEMDYSLQNSKGG